jgi:hypothetical protein
VVLAMERDSTENKAVPMSTVENPGRGRGISTYDLVAVVSMNFRALNF